MYVKLFFIFIALSFSIYQSQIPGLINYNENDGLNSSYNYHLRQDKEGFIWIGSDNGLFKFDGKEFRQYGKEDGLKNIEVISCEPLPNGEVFIIPFLNDFAYLKNGKIINSDINNHLKYQLGSSIPGVERDGNRLYLYSMKNPKNLIVYENGKIKKIPLLINFHGKPYYTLKFDVRNKILYLQNDEEKAITAYHTVTHQIRIIPFEKSGFMFHKDNFITFQDKNNLLHVFRFVSPYRLKKIRTYAVKEKFFYTFIDRNYKLWVSLVNGGTLFYNQSLKESGRKPIKPVKFLDKYIVHHILVDKDDNVWFNSRNDGLFFIARAFFENHIGFPLKNNSEYIKSIERNGEDIVLGYNRSAGGIYRNGRFQNIVFNRYDKTECRSVLAKGKYIIFGFSDKFLVYDTVSKTQSANILSTKNLVSYSWNSVLLCLVNGLFTYDLKTGNKDLIFPERCYTALPFAKDSLFVGSFSDLYKVNAKTKRKKIFLKGYYFTDLKKLHDNLYAGATNLNGIILFDSKGIVKKITEHTGLISDQVKKITVENQNTFWAGTNSGISRIELRGNRFTINNFTKTDGLPSNLVAGCVMRNDSVFIGTSKGLGRFSIKKLLVQEKSINKKVIVNSVKIGDKEYFGANKKLEGTSPEDVTFNVSFPDYASQGKIGYRYLVEGLNHKWQINNSSKIILSSLPPGKYVLKIFGLGYNGKESFRSTDTEFEIHPLFWQTRWFRLLVAILAMVILILGMSVYFKRKRSKKLEKIYYGKKIAELELQAIKAQINPHFIYNCLNSIKYLLFKEDYEETENYLDTFSQLIRKTLYYSEQTFMPIRDEAEYLFLYMDMEKLRQNELFDYEIHISEQVNRNWIIPSLLIQPFVENAIKHGISGLKNRKGFIKISFDHTDSTLCITIEDNGDGIRIKNESFAGNNSFGLKLSQKRIETFKQLFETNIILEIINLSEKYGKHGTQIKLYITSYENENTNLHH
ncbi:histidine kinase [Chryseobacterium sp. SSA4.19]|uniref:sensor histidine kinase n=1 Tax=Chryseobacterium sp. SSA4.19 TaxID=2919915 RepID=UPI001F4D38E5|nr:histidine kinase [Chryseobacterium sp. SSA4.19]MCJ8154868.1 histidine kinase [Chryseobacterium sp. SSA4.19]